MNFQKTALCIFSKCLVHGIIGLHSFRGFVLITIAKMEILAIFRQYEADQKISRLVLHQVSVIPFKI